jgi:8-oxo-dGTP pyrophosphatase MutT (NUDIX family)
MTRAPLTEAALREPIRRALGSREPERLPLGATTAAAVLVPLSERDGETCVWLVRRPNEMRSHAGQVAFPGGKNDPADDSLRATALREAQEELGIVPSRVDVLGALDDYLTITGFTITPWVGWLAEPVEITPNPNEVARVFAVPLRAFFAPPTRPMPWSGWEVEGEFVWGATAAIVRGFVAILREIVPDAKVSLGVRQ